VPPTYVRFVAIIATLYGSLPVNGQSELWRQVVPIYARPETRELNLPAAKERSLAGVLQLQDEVDNWSCQFEDPRGEWRRHLRFEEISLASPGRRILLIEAGPGCARGGQGSNGAMWLLALDRDKLRLLATPQKGFNGWIYSIQPEKHNGLADIVVGWHMSAFEADLSYFRFDGHIYRKATTATISDRNGSPQITPSPVNIERR